MISSCSYSSLYVHTLNCISREAIMYSSSRGRGVLGQVLDRDAQHRPSTRNATRVKKRGGVETIHFAQVWWKIGVEIRHFPHFCWNIGVESIQIFQRPEYISGYEILTTARLCTFPNWTPNLAQQNIKQFLKFSSPQPNNNIHDSLHRVMKIWPVKSVAYSRI